jgi:hypothetical protein
LEFTKGGDNVVIPQDVLLVKVLYLVREVLADLKLPPRRGAPYTYSPTVIVCCLVVMVGKGLKVRGLYSYLTKLPDGVALAVREAIPFPEDTIPNRRTFDRRFAQSITVLPLVMLCTTKLLIKRFGLGVARLALDNRMFEAVGSIWHRRDQKQGIIPQKLRGVDTTAGWGVSAYRGWVWGHGLDTFVTTGKLVVPIVAIARSLTMRGNRAVLPIVHLLPKVCKGVVAADSEYEDHKLGRVLAQTGRSLHTPRKRYPDQVPKSKTYYRRKVTVEPAFERFLLAFGQRDKLDRKGPQAWPYLMTCVCIYQLMVIYNLTIHAPNPLEVTHLICIL